MKKTWNQHLQHITKCLYWRKWWLHTIDIYILIWFHTSLLYTLCKLSLVQPKSTWFFYHVTVSCSWVISGLQFYRGVWNFLFFTESGRCKVFSFGEGLNKTCRMKWFCWNIWAFKVRFVSFFWWTIQRPSESWNPTILCVFHFHPLINNNR